MTLVKERARLGPRGGGCKSAPIQEIRDAGEKEPAGAGQLPAEEGFS